MQKTTFFRGVIQKIFFSECEKSYVFRGVKFSVEPFDEVTFSLSFTGNFVVRSENFFSRAPTRIKHSQKDLPSEKAGFLRVFNSRVPYKKRCFPLEKYSFSHFFQRKHLPNLYSRYRILMQQSRVCVYATHMHDNRLPFPFWEIAT